MKLKTIILSGLMSLACFSMLHAQQAQYDLAVVGYFYDTPKPQIVISMNGEKFEQADVEREELQNARWGINLNPLIKRVNKLQSEGWEVVGGLSTSGLPAISMFYYSLRKKK
ncbi:MAG: hypothetical protein IPP77_03120 [Bacteroidetes bacterium]|nr:hypothetical protein [Bacteroidota bacterium]